MNLHTLIKRPTKTAAKIINRNRHIELLARFGYVSNGIIHGLIGSAVITLAFGSVIEADQSGVLSPLGNSMYGKALLLTICMGLVSLSIWKISAVILMRGKKRKNVHKRQIEESGKGLIYLIIGLSSATYLFNKASASRSSAATSQHVAQQLLTSTPGLVLLYGISVGLVTAGALLIYHGASRRFLDSLDSEVHVVLNHVAVWCGVVGYVTKGIMFIVLGGVFFSAAISLDPSRASGLDGAFKSFSAFAFGAPLLFLVGLGFIMHAIYSIARARLAEM